MENRHVDFRSYTLYLFIRNLIFFWTMKLTDKTLWITIQYICVLFLSVCLLGLIVSDLIFVWVIAMFFWLFIPAFIVACISFVCSLRCNSKHKKNTTNCIVEIALLMKYISDNTKQNKVCHKTKCNQTIFHFVTNSAHNRNPWFQQQNKQIL